MVSFRNLVVSAFALAAPIAAQAQASPAQVVDNLKTLTQKAQALQAPAQDLTIINGVLIVTGQGPFPQIITGYSDIVNVGSSYAQTYSPITPAPTADEQTSIYEAYREFTRVNQATFNILIGKAGLFNTVPFVGQPMAAVLRATEGVYDTITSSLIDQTPTKTADFQAQDSSLSSTLDTCIQSYEGLMLNKRSLRFATRAGATEA